MNPPGWMKAALTTAGSWTAPVRVTPDYLIVGGKRCGTTSLQAALAGHPAVVPPHSGKGTHYFDENYAKGDAWFRAHYPTKLAMRIASARGGTAAITGEASPYYAFHPAGLQRIADRLPGARLIFVLREPVERAYSHWRYERRRGFEDLDIDAALDAEGERLRGEEERLIVDPSYVSWPHRHFSYVARSRYAEQLDRCFKLFPRDQVALVRFDELAGSSSAEVLRSLCAFLGLPAEGIGALPRLEAGGESSAVPPAVRDRLEDVLREDKARLREEYGVDFT